MKTTMSGLLGACHRLSVFHRDPHTEHYFELYGAPPDPAAHAPGFHHYDIAGRVEPIIDTADDLPKGSFVVATRRGDAAIVTKAISHIDVDLDRMPEHASEWYDARRVRDEVLRGWGTVIDEGGPKWFRVYRTFSGFRVLLPWHRDVVLVSTFVQGADIRYLRVTIMQDGFHRIRITPKPWRRNSEYRVAELHDGSGAIFDDAATQVVHFHDRLCLRPIWQPHPCRS